MRRGVTLDDGGGSNLVASDFSFDLLQTVDENVVEGVEFLGEHDWVEDGGRSMLVSGSEVL
jgi:hypothetical protein